jgi:hypothetical protein
VARLPHPLASGALTPAHVPVGRVWHHIFLDRFPDPLGFGFASSRFSNPRRKLASRVGVYYAGQTFEVAFLETIVRDLRNGNRGRLLLSAKDLDDYVHVHVTVRRASTWLIYGGAIPLPWACRPMPCVRARTDLASLPAWRSTSEPTSSTASGIRPG